MKNDLYFGFGAGYEARICHSHRQRTSNEAAKVSGWMSELILLIVSTLDGDENAKVVGPWRDADTRPGELRT